MTTSATTGGMQIKLIYVADAEIFTKYFHFHFPLYKALKKESYNVMPFKG